MWNRRSDRLHPGNRPRTFASQSPAHRHGRPVRPPGIPRGSSLPRLAPRPHPAFRYIRSRVILGKWCQLESTTDHTSPRVVSPIAELPSTDPRGVHSGNRSPARVGTTVRDSGPRHASWTAVASGHVLSVATRRRVADKCLFIWEFQRQIVRWSSTESNSACHASTSAPSWSFDPCHPAGTRTLPGIWVTVRPENASSFDPSLRRQRPSGRKRSGDRQNTSAYGTQLPPVRARYRAVGELPVSVPAVPDSHRGSTFEPERVVRNGEFPRLAVTNLPARRRRARSERCSHRPVPARLC